MAIWICEFCNAYVSDFEVHYCRNFGNQHRQSSATLPRPSSANRVQDVDSISAVPMNYGAEGQINSSTQQSVLPNIYQRTDCEATETAEIQSSYGIENQSQHNPETSDFMFLYMPQVQENQSESTPSPIADRHNPIPVAEPRLLPGFQQAFGQRNALAIQMAQRTDVSSQIDCSGIPRTDETPSQLISNFNENFNASANLMSQHYETSKEMPTSVDLNAQYNPMDPIPPTDSTGPIHSSKCPKDFQPKYPRKPSDLSRSVKRPYDCDYCDKTFPFPSVLTKHIRSHTGEKPFKCKVCNRCFTQNCDLAKHMRVHNRRTLHKCTECSESFVFRYRLEEHFSSIHPGKKLYECEQCGKGFASLSLLNRHMLIHTKV
ncbi:hypothetical protein CDAR_430261 [Caerostris darwini]|uniref:C2H2-type domain-containing protein n=1 Tax=Caerostris darwini TaxID=1538125 RepID=A0AAV4W3K6_9ARAC|nr:hypothetical protein CDAR_430261 [Caerostris darwini]